MPSEGKTHISPLVHESILHNNRTLTNLQNVIASLLGITAGILGLESYAGFVFYAVFSVLATVLFYAVRVAPTAGRDTGAYYLSAVKFWTGGLGGGLAGYILTWTLFYGLVRA